MAIQARKEKSFPLTPIYEIIRRHDLARHEEDVLETVASHMEQNRCSHQGGGHGMLVCVIKLQADLKVLLLQVRVVILVRIVGRSDSSHRVVVFTDDASHLAN